MIRRKNKYQIKDKFKRDRKCVVVEIMLLPKVEKTIRWHNGYVAVKEENRGKEAEEFQDEIDTVMLTYAGNLGNYDIETEEWFFGFDTAHSWNDKRPQSKTFPAVKKKTIKLANEMVRKGI